MKNDPPCECGHPLSDHFDEDPLGDAKGCWHSIDLHLRCSCPGFRLATVLPLGEQAELPVARALKLPPAPRAAPRRAPRKPDPDRALRLALIAFVVALIAGSLHLALRIVLLLGIGS